jgi:hypothetical protein
MNNFFKKGLGMVVHTCNPSVGAAAEASLHNKTLSPKEKKRTGSLKRQHIVGTQINGR